MPQILFSGHLGVGLRLRSEQGDTIVKSSNMWKHVGPLATANEQARGSFLLEAFNTDEVEEILEVKSVTNGGQPVKPGADGKFRVTNPGLLEVDVQKTPPDGWKFGGKSQVKQFKKTVVWTDTGKSKELDAVPPSGKASYCYGTPAGTCINLDEDGKKTVRFPNENLTEMVYSEPDFPDGLRFFVKEGTEEELVYQTKDGTKNFRFRYSDETIRILTWVARITIGLILVVSGIYFIANCVDIFRRKIPQHSKYLSKIVVSEKNKDIILLFERDLQEMKGKCIFFGFAGACLIAGGVCAWIYLPFPQSFGG